MTDHDTEPDERFRRAYEAYRARVYAYAVSRAGRQLADDIVSDTFLVAWRKVEALPPTPLPWLLAVARNVTRERYRDEVKQASLAAEMRAWVAEASADVADDVADRAAVLSAFARLSDEDRELLTLTAWHGLSAKEAAEVLDCTTAAYFVRLHRARRRLAQATGRTQPQRRHVPLTNTLEEFHS